MIFQNIEITVVIESHLINQTFVLYILLVQESLLSMNFSTIRLN